MTSTSAVGFGALLGTALAAVGYTTLPVYHDFICWSYGLVGINLEGLIGF